MAVPKEKCEKDFVVELNVGGKVISTLKSTLTKDEKCLLAKMLKDDGLATRDSSGRYFLDCNPKIFSHVLDFLRFGLVPPAEKVVQVYEYAKRFNINKLIEIMEQFNAVQCKVCSDKAKSQLDLEKYEKLKMDIISALMNSNKYTDICLFIYPNSNPKYYDRCICTTPKGVRRELFGGSLGFQVNVIIQTTIKADIDVPDDNLLKALTEDMYLLGFGKMRHNFSQGSQHCSGCNKPCYGSFCVLFSSRQERNITSFNYEWTGNPPYTKFSMTGQDWRNVTY